MNRCALFTLEISIKKHTTIFTVQMLWFQFFLLIDKLPNEQHGPGQIGLISSNEMFLARKQFLNASKTHLIWRNVTQKSCFIACSGEIRNVRFQYE